MTKDYIVVLDACVLVGGGLRDTLLRLAETPRLYLPKWSDDIIREVMGVLEHRFNKSPEERSRLQEALREAFPEAWVCNYKNLEAGLTNDPKDRHIFAAAIKCSAQSIVTFNLRDFPAESLRPYDVEAIHPDEFLVNQFHLDDAIVTRKFTEQASAIGRTVEDQLHAFHRTRAFPLFTQTLADALSICL
jgi:predicted nucleic acid-binding protein